MVYVSGDGEGCHNCHKSHYKSFRRECQKKKWWHLSWSVDQRKVCRKIVGKRGHEVKGGGRGTWHKTCLRHYHSPQLGHPIHMLLAPNWGNWIRLTCLSRLLESSCQSLFCLSAREPARVSGSAWVGNDRQSQPLRDALEGGEERADHSLAAPLESDKL